MEQKPFNLEEALGELDAKICDMVEKTFDAESINRIDQRLEKTIESAASTIKQTTLNMTEAFVQKQEDMKQRSNNKQLYAKMTGPRILGFFMAIVGYLYGFVFAIALFSADRPAAAIPLIILALGLLFLGTNGAFRIQRTKRFEQYVRYFKASGKAYEQVDELAKIVRKDASFVSKELQKMVASSWFKQGHFIESDQVLIVNHETFKTYQQVRSEQLAKERQVAQEEQSLPAQAREMLTRGNDYLIQLKAGAAGIEEAIIKEKLIKLENVIEKIFDYVKEHPEAANGLQKMINHYLPMTVKIVDSYARLSIPTPTPQITSAKTEIEEMLDTLTSAFEKLLTRLFKEVVWDASTDVSVLQNMLANEGLVKKDFEV